MSLSAIAGWGNSLPPFPFYLEVPQSPNRQTVGSGAVPLSSLSQPSSSLFAAMGVRVFSQTGANPSISPERKMRSAGRASTDTANNTTPSIPPHPAIKPQF